MCVSFDPETIYKNAFFAYKRENYMLYKSDIVEFCNILLNEVSKKSEENIKYKYVYLDFNRNTLTSFYEDCFGTFKIIGDDIYLNKAIEENEIRKVNIAYDDCIKKALADTRGIFFKFLNRKSYSCNFLISSDRSPRRFLKKEFQFSN